MSENKDEERKKKKQKPKNPDYSEEPISAV